MTTPTTLLNLVQAISLAADNDQEIVATVAYVSILRQSRRLYKREPLKAGYGTSF